MTLKAKSNEISHHPSLSRENLSTFQKALKFNAYLLYKDVFKSSKLFKQ